MGRSVNYHSDAHEKIYLQYDYPTEIITDEETGEERENTFDDDWDDYKDYLIETMQDIAPSLTDCKKEWHDREVLKILENNLCSVWISEYCGLVSLSFVPDEDKEGLAKHWIDQVIGKIRQKFIDNKSQVLSKLGTFSNGEGVFELAK